MRYEEYPECFGFYKWMDNKEECKNCKFFNECLQELEEILEEIELDFIEFEDDDL